MKDLKQTIIDRSQQKDGKKTLPCAVAFVIATEFDVKPSEIGKICNDEKIRICKCQLGCF